MPRSLRSLRSSTRRKRGVTYAPFADLRAFGIYRPENYGGGILVADNGPAIDAAIADMPSIPDSYGGASGTLLFGSGKYVGGRPHITPSNTRISVQGVQAYSTILLRKAGSTGDWWTVNGSNCGLDRLTLATPTKAPPVTTFS